MVDRLARVRVVGPLEPYGLGFRRALDEQGYAPSSALAQLRLLAHMSRWMSTRSLSPGDLAPALMAEFIRDRTAAGYRHLVALQSVSPILTHLRGLGVSPQVAAWEPATPEEELIERYRCHVVAERGLAAGTVRYYTRAAGLFLSWAAGDEGLDLGRLTTAEVSRFVLAESRRRSVGSAKNLVAALRSFLRYLYLEGVTVRPLVGAVPSVAPFHRARRARALDEQEVARLLAGCDRRTGTGRRDFAILVLLSRLGLRAGEVAAIELDDIDWRAGEIMIHGKGGRHDALPVPVDVGEALAGYLQRGRPGTQCRRLFLRVKAPIAALTGDGVSNVVRAACRRAGVAVVRAHRLRHFAATQTLRKGAPLAEIGQLLRQQCTYTTATYAKVNRVALSPLARPWPGGAA